MLGSVKVRYHPAVTSRPSWSNRCYRCQCPQGLDAIASIFHVEFGHEKDDSDAFTYMNMYMHMHICISI